MAEPSATTQSSDKKSEKKKSQPPREVPGNFPYTTSHGVFKQILEAMITAERPQRFSGDFLNTVLGFKGGSAGVVPPILKRTGFLNSDASPTELYSRFKSSNARSQAGLEALRSGFGELFKRNEYAHKLSDDDLKDLLVQITGFNKSDGVVRAIAGTFGAIRSFIDLTRLNEETLNPSNNTPLEKIESLKEQSTSPNSQNSSEAKLGLVYNINLVLPNTDNPNVLNAIFKSIKQNLLA